MNSFSGNTFIKTNGINLFVVQSGPEDGPLVILLHGFPEFWYGWRYQIEPLAAAGFHVWVPDQRGYNESDKPKGVDSYRLETCTQDVLGLIQASGREKASIVGHDWGGIVAWWLGIRCPERVERLAILNAPHLAASFRAVLRDPTQFVRSLYALYFQIPWLPEAMLRNDNWELVVKGMQMSSRPGAFSEADFEQYRRAWWRRGAFTSMLNWYRANFRHPPRLPADPRIHAPVAILWGARDVALSRVLAEESVKLCDQGELVFFEEATHWVHHEEAQAVNQHLLEFLQRN